MKNVVGPLMLFSALGALVCGLVSWASMLACSQVFAVKIPERWTKSVVEHTPAWYPMRDAVNALIAAGVVEELNDPVLRSHAARYAKSSRMAVYFVVPAGAALLYLRFGP